MSVLVICEILGQVINTFTADNKYSLRNSEKLQESIQIQLSQKQKIYTTFLHLFWNLLHNLNILKKRDELQSFCIPEITDCKRRGLTNV